MCLSKERVNFKRGDVVIARLQGHFPAPAVVEAYVGIDEYLIRWLDGSGHQLTSRLS